MYPVDLNTLETVVKQLEDIVVKGIPGVSRVVVQQDKDMEHRVYVEGPKLREVRCDRGLIDCCLRIQFIQWAGIYRLSFGCSPQRASV